MFGIFKKKKTKADDDLSLVFAASVTASILVALSDGKMSHEQRDRLVETVAAGMKNIMSPREILKEIEKQVSMVKNASSETCHGIMVKLSEDLSDESKKIILHAAGNMALVDRKFTVAEQQKIRQIARWAVISEQEFKIWKTEFQNTIDQQIASGILPNLDYNNNDWKSLLYDK